MSGMQIFGLLGSFASIIGLFIGGKYLYIKFIKVNKSKIIDNSVTKVKLKKTKITGDFVGRDKNG